MQQSTYIAACYYNHYSNVYSSTQCSPASVDCGTVIIGTSSQHTLTLSNPSPCSLAYQLLVDSSIAPPGSSLKQGQCYRQYVHV